MKSLVKKNNRTAKNLLESSIIDNLNDGIIATDTREKIIFINQYAKEIIGNFHSKKGQSLKDYLPDQKRRFFLNGIEKLRAEDNLRQIALKTDINKRKISACFSNIRNGSGKILGSLILLRDITQESYLDRKKTNFMTDVSHALRTPITAIQGAADLILKGIGGRPNKKHKEFTNIISKNCKRLSNLINDVVRIAQIETERIPLNIQKTDLASLLEFYLSQFNEKIKDKAVLLEKDMPASASIDVIIDSEKIGDAFAILLNNVLRHTPKKGKIKICVDIKESAPKYEIEFKIYNPDSKKGFIEVSIHNQYKGITEKQVGQLFDKYEKIKNFEPEGNKPDTDGKVLSLPLARKLVESHDGKLWVEGGKGRCSFHFTIPLNKSEFREEERFFFIEDAKPKDEKWPIDTDGKSKVLVVNDNNLAGEMYRRVLEESGFLVYSGTDKEDAIDLARKFRPNIIVIDVIMPEIDGASLVKVLREDPETKIIPIIFFSAHEDNNIKLKDLGAVTIAKRPADEKAFISQVNSALLQHQGKADSRGKILIVDDELSISSLISSMLQEFGYMPIEVRTGEDAISVAQTEQPALILLDINLPGIDGFEALERLKNNSSTSNIPVILLSGIKDAKMKAKGLNLGASDYMTKPYSSLELEARIRLLIQRKEDEFNTSPTTRLPGNIAIEKEINARITGKKPFSVCYVDLDNFKAYNDNYGFLKGDAVIRQAAKIITDVVKELGNASDFVGHIGGDDFIVITTIEKDDIICRSIIDAFGKVIPLYYNKDDRAKGYIEIENRRGLIEKFPIMTISIAVVISNEQRRLEHFAQISDIAAEVKKAAKKMEGSVYIKDRRFTTEDITSKVKGATI